MRGSTFWLVTLLTLAPMSARADEQPSTPAAQPSTLRDFIDANDRRYEQRFKGLEMMLDAYDRRYEQRFLSQEKAVVAALSTQKEAVEKAEDANTKRFDSMNEFRGQLKDQAATLLPRAEFDSLKMDVAKLLPRAEYEAKHEVVTALASRMDRLETRLATLASAKEDSRGEWGTAFGAIGMAVGVIGVLAMIFTVRNRQQNGRQESPRGNVES